MFLMRIFGIIATLFLLAQCVMEEVSAIYYDTNIPYQDIYSSTTNYSQFSTHYDTSNLYYSDQNTSQGDYNYRKSLACTIFATGGTQTNNYYTDANLGAGSHSWYLNHSGGTVSYKIFQNSTTVELYNFTLSTFIASTGGLTPIDNHPNENSICVITSYIEKISGLDQGTYMHEIQWYHYHGSTVTFGARSFHDFDPIGVKFKSTVNSSPKYIGGWGRYVFVQPVAVGGSTYYSITNNAIRNAFLADFLAGTGSSNLANSLPDYYGATNFVNSYVPTSTGGTSGSGSTSSGSVTDGWYTTCSGFTDIGCYISSTIDGAFSAIIPDISFDDPFESCVQLSSTGSITTIQKFGNLITLLNPVPPGEGDSICTIEGSKVMGYQRMIPEANFFEIYGGSQVPSYLHGDGRIAYGQTVVDVFVIVVFSILIFYHRKND